MVSDVKVLLVDDKATVRKTIKSILRTGLGGIHCTFDEAKSGEEALVFIAEKDFDVVFLDIKLPGIDGIETLKRANEMRTHNFGRVIVLTGSMEPEYAQEATTLGVFQYLTKDPIDMDKLRGAFEKALEPERSGALAGGASRGPTQNTGLG